MKHLRRLAIVAVSTIVVTTGYVVTATGASAGIITGHP